MVTKVTVYRIYSSLADDNQYVYRWLCYCYLFSRNCEMCFILHHHEVQI